MLSSHFSFGTDGSGDTSSPSSKRKVSFLELLSSASTPKKEEKETKTKEKEGRRSRKQFAENGEKFLHPPKEKKKERNPLPVIKARKRGRRVGVSGLVEMEEGK